MQFSFNGYMLNTDRRELSCGSEPIAVEPQVFDLLAYLVQHRDRVVTKDDLLEAVWGGRIVSGSALTTRINAARRAIGDSGEAQRLIRTLPRKGVRFIAEVKEQVTSLDFAAPQRATEFSEKPSIVVPPFQNLSDDPELEYFAEGLSRGNHHRVEPHSPAVRHRGQFDTYLQRSDDRCGAGRPRTWLALCARRLGA